MHIEADRPEFMMRGLTKLEFCHPIKDLARVEIAQNPPLKLLKKRRMNRVTQIEQDVRPGQPTQKRFPRQTNAADGIQIMLVVRLSMIEKAIASAQPMLAQLS